MRKTFSFVFVWRWTLVFFILAVSFWIAVYFITGNAPAVRYAFIEHYLADNIFFTNISWYKLFLLDKIFPVFVPFVKYNQILVAQLPFILPRWCDVLLIPVFLPLISFIFKKEYLEVNKITNINDDDEDGFINSLYRGRYSIYIIMASLSLIYIVASIIIYPPQNADLDTYTSDIEIWREAALQFGYIIFAAFGGIANGVVIGIYFSRVKPARTLPLSLIFVFCLSMLLAGLGGGIVQGLVTAIIITLSHFYSFAITLIVVFIFLSIKKVFIFTLNTSPVRTLQRWLGIPSRTVVENGRLIEISLTKENPKSNSFAVSGKSFFVVTTHNGGEFKYIISNWDNNFNLDSNFHDASIGLEISISGSSLYFELIGETESVFTFYVN